MSVQRRTLCRHECVPAGSGGGDGGGGGGARAFCAAATFLMQNIPVRPSGHLHRPLRHEPPLFQTGQSTTVLQTPSFPCWASAMARRSSASRVARSNAPSAVARAHSSEVHSTTRQPLPPIWVVGSKLSVVSDLERLAWFHR